MPDFFESTWFTIIDLLLLFISVAGGYIIARKRYYKHQRQWKPSGTENAIVGFYSLLISFALLSSGNSHKDRTNMVHQHADALSAIYREGQYSGGVVRNLITDYTIQILSCNVALGKEENRTKRAILDKTNDSLYRSFFAAIERLNKDGSLSDNEKRFYLDKLHTAIALDYHLQYSDEERTPGTIMILLILGGT
jgi:hypothetical protein